MKISKQSFIILMLIISVLVGCTVKNDSAISADVELGKPALVPWPVSIDLGPGALMIESSSRIVYTDKSLEPLAKIFSADIKRVHDIELPVVSSKKARQGDILLELSKDPNVKGDRYKVTVEKTAAIEAGNYNAIALGTITLLQSMTKHDDGIAIPSMTVVDEPHREFRAHMIDIKNRWHTVEDIQQFIDLCRFYKVRYLSLHTGEAQWLGAVMDSTSGIPVEQRVRQRLYTKEEMDGLIQYAKARGVLLFPHNETTPSMPGMKKAVATDYNTSDEYNGWLDEVDGKGAYEISGAPSDDRFWAFIREATHRSIDQFAAGFPDNKLPFYHMGPVLGEGGASPAMGVKVLGFIQEKDPDIKLMFWQGNDPRSTRDLAKYKDDIIIACYSYHGSPPDQYLKNGYTIINSGWSPLYIVGEGIARTQKQVFEDWNYYRYGLDGFTGSSFEYKAIKWYDFNKPEWYDQVQGSMLCTWEVPTYVHLDRSRVRIPAFAENAWHYKEWPYTEDDYKDFADRYKSTNAMLTKFLGMTPQVSTVPKNIKATDGSTKEKVNLKWSGSANSPLGYRVYRSKTNDMNDAKKISEDVYGIEYSDTTAVVNQKYYYWVKSFNEVGESDFSKSVMGTAGDGIAKTKAYEPFDYPESASIDKQKGGTGWKGTWKLNRTSGTVSIEKESLSYGTLPTSGGSIKLNPAEERRGIAFSRDVTDIMGLDETTMWLSFLIRVNKLGDGHFFVVPNRNIAAAPGKMWGRRFAFNNDSSSIDMESGKTYFIVVRYDFKYGPDGICMWINPELGEEPEPGSAAKTMDFVDARTGVNLEVQVQGWKLGDYNFDELRVGPTWEYVTGGGDVKGGVAGDVDDNDPPTPDPMTWMVPPEAKDGNTISMAAAIASDDSGVEYYFEETTGNLGGDDSGWQDSSNYTDAGLQAGIKYTYRVKVRDKSAKKNGSAWSFSISATTTSESDGGE